MNCSVSCSATSGSLAVTTSTTGSDVDPDGYSVTVAATCLSSSDSKSTVTQSGVPISS